GELRAVQEAEEPERAALAFVQPLVGDVEPGAHVEVAEAQLVQASLGPGEPLGEFAERPAAGGRESGARDPDRQGEPSAEPYDDLRVLELRVRQLPADDLLEQGDARVDGRQVEIDGLRAR